MDNKKLPYIAKWLKYSRDEVLNKFMSINGAFTDGTKQERFVYVPGTRDDKCLLVAHADTVWGDLDIGLDYYSGILFSNKRFEEVKYTDGTTKIGIGIGADDRAGCGLVWKLRELGHSILITTGEEIGCVATKRLMSSDYWKKELNNHSFAIEFDRRYHNDIVFYDVATNAFVQYVKENTGYKPAKGFGTDIRYICKDICGVNMSVGYIDEHCSFERLVVPHWENTLMIAKEWLSKPIKRFNQSFVDKYEFKEINDSYTFQSSNPIEQSSQNSSMDGFVFCSKCRKFIKQEYWLENNFSCSSCKQEI